MPFDIIELGIASQGSKAEQAYQELIELTSISPSLSPHEIIAEYWKGIDKLNYDRSTHGKLLEYLIMSCLWNHGIRPFYIDVQVLHVRGVVFDIVLFRDGTHPIVLSSKVSLRERWKQAELEGRLLNQVYPKAESHLITLNADEARNIGGKIESGDSIGLASVVVATTNQFSILLDNLSAFEYSAAKDFPTIISGSMIA